MPSAAQGEGKGEGSLSRPAVAYLESQLLQSQPGLQSVFKVTSATSVEKSESW